MCFLSRAPQIGQIIELLMEYRSLTGFSLPCSLLDWPDRKTEEIQITFKHNFGETMSWKVVSKLSNAHKIDQKLHKEGKPCVEKVKLIPFVQDLKIK